MFKITNSIKLYFLCANLEVLMNSGHWCMCCAQVVDEVRTGTYRQLFHPEQLISGKEDGELEAGADGNFNLELMVTKAWTFQGRRIGCSQIAPAEWSCC